jgi:LCP family protein required for cell wall assembly
MDNFKQPSRREQQKAIDGILFGSDQPQTPAKPIARRRFRGVHHDIAPVRPATTRTPRPEPARSQLAKQAVAARPPVAPQPSLSLPKDDDTVPDELLPDKLDLDLQGSGRKTGKKPKKARFAFFRHPIKTFKGWNWKKRTIFIIATLVILGALIVGFLFFKGYFNAKKVFKGGSSSKVIEEKKGRINILLLGNGGDGHEAPDLTDTILIASIDPVNKKTSLISIPRDLYVETPEHGSMKINAVYETGKYEFLGRQDSSNNNFEAVSAGFKAADAAVEDVLGIDIHYHALVDFTAFRQAVDSVGGITVEVPETLSDPMFTRENGGSPVIARAGTQNFDGKKALMYARSRYTSSDFARAQRQRAIIVALQQKIFSAGTLSSPAKISQLMDAFGNNAKTDLSLKDISSLYEMTKGMQPNQIESVGLTDEPNILVKTGMVGNQSVVLPVAGVGNYDEIHAYIKPKVRDGNLIKENATVAVYNGTTESGKAQTIADELKAQGYNVVAVGDAPTQAYEESVVIDRTNGKKKFSSKDILKTLEITKSASKVPDQAIQTQNADFVVILGVR